MRTIVLFGFVMSTVLLKAQGYGDQWVLGPNASVLDFRNATIRLDSLHNNIWFFLTSACISDETGNLLYSCYGPCAMDKNGDTLLNGCNLSPCNYSATHPYGFALPQAAIFLPMPGFNRYYYLFHFSCDTSNDTRPGTLYFSIVDKTGNGGLGEVVVKNNPILQGQILRGGGMTACKHANGRDYWLIMGASVINKFYTFLISPDGVTGPFVQNIGPQFPLPYDISCSKFSPDGSKFATGIYDGPIVVMDFDRCSGTFSNPLNIYHNASYDPVHNPINGCNYLEFSPSSQFLYISNSNDLTQYDLLASNIQDSTELYVQDSSDFYGIHMLQTAANGKLYCSTWAGGLHALHLVEHPDVKGDSANFIYAGQPTWSDNSFNLPNLINYKLGPLVGSSCDTINGVNSPGISKGEELIRVQPNPANKYVYVEVAMQGNYEFDLLNETGQLIAKAETRQVDNFDTEKLANGVYFINVLNKKDNSEIGVKRVVVVH